MAQLPSRRTILLLSGITIIVAVTLIIALRTLSVQKLEQADKSLETEQTQ